MIDERLEKEKYLTCQNDVSCHTISCCEISFPIQCLEREMNVHVRLFAIWFVSIH